MSSNASNHYSRRIPKSLLVPLPDDKNYYRSRKALLRTLPEDVRVDELRVTSALVTLVSNGDTMSAWYVLGKHTAWELQHCAIFELACEMGNADLVRMLIWTGKTYYDIGLCMRAIRLQHWDVMHQIIVSGKYIPAHIACLVTSSVTAYRYFRQKYPNYRFAGNELGSAAVRNSYVYGFDREMLECVCTSRGSHNLVLGCIVPEHIVTIHHSAPETLRFLLGHYPDILWPLHLTLGRVCMLFEVNGEVMGEIRAILTEYGIPKIR